VLDERTNPTDKGCPMPFSKGILEVALREHAPLAPLQPTQNQNVGNRIHTDTKTISM
jgi:hypothetical protein